MAEGFLKSFDSEIEVYSAGTKPADRVNTFAVIAMKEGLIFPQYFGQGEKIVYV